MLLGKFPPRIPALAAGSLFVVFAAAAAGQTDPSSPLVLPQYVVSATRTPQDPQFTPSSVDLLPLADLAAAQIPDLRTALAEVPGVYIANTGATGGQSSIFLRGASSHQTLFIVDGVRMNDRSAAYFNFLGTADLNGLDRIEVLRGPQSTLYGSSAMGGVVLLDSAHGCAQPTGLLSAVGGSFGTVGGAATVAGGAHDLGGSLSVARFRTDNELPENGYDQTAWAARAESQLSPVLLVGATTRGQQGDYDEVGSRIFASSAQVASDNYLTTAYAQWRPDNGFFSRLTLAQHQRRYSYVSAFYDSELRNRRDILDWQNTWTRGDTAEITAGGNLERSTYTIDGTATHDRSEAGFLAATWRPVRRVTADAGIRYDHFTSVGGATTWRTGLSWVSGDGTKLHATYGTGFTAPGSDDRYGVPEFGQLPNPDLRPEKSQGWDAGIEHRFAHGALRVSATYFQNRFRDLFEFVVTDYATFTGQIVNRARAATSGVELAADSAFARRFRVRLAYTYLDARDQSGDTRLLRRPRHVLDAELRAETANRWTVGTGVHVVADRWDTRLDHTDGFVSYFANGRIEDYTTVRVFASYALATRLELKVRVENALNERYEEVYGYPALPRGAFGSLTWRY